MTDLWGELPITENMRTIHAMMMEQASLLQSKTQGLLVGAVARGQQDSTSFLSVLSIIAPALNNYTYAVCQAAYPITIYPARFLSFGDKTGWVQIPDERAFLNALAGSLTSPETKRIVAGLVAQIRADDAGQKAAASPQ
jgi:hypothetical protein